MTQVKRYRRGKEISSKEVLAAQKRIASSMKADVYVPSKDVSVEWAIGILILMFVIVLVSYFSYQKGIQDQALSDVTKISDASYAKGLDEGKIQGRKEGELTGKVIQRAKDLIACQKHSNIKRSENHCVGEID